MFFLPLVYFPAAVITRRSCGERVWEAIITFKSRPSLPSLGENAEKGMENGFTAGPSRSTERKRQVLKTENRWPGLGLGLLLLTFSLTQPRKTTGPFWVLSQSHEKVEKETLKPCARPVLSELQNAELGLTNSVLDCTRQELWNGRSVSEAS